MIILKFINFIYHTQYTMDIRNFENSSEADSSRVNFENIFQTINNDLIITTISVRYKIGTQLFLDNIRNSKGSIFSESRFYNLLSARHIHNSISAKIFENGMILLTGVKDIKSFDECIDKISRELSNKLFVKDPEKIGVYDIKTLHISVIPKDEKLLRENFKSTSSPEVLLKKLYLCKLLLEEKNNDINIRCPLEYDNFKSGFANTIILDIKYKKYSSIMLFISGNYVICSRDIDKINESYLYIKERLQLYANKLVLITASGTEVLLEGENIKEELINFLSATYNIDKNLIYL